MSASKEAPDSAQGRYDAVPEELEERDQWLLWDASADTPRRPHWRGDFGISWSDPESWHTFEEAVEAASGRESWGIGYVMALDNPDYPRGLYGCLDLDGCLREPNQPKPKEWVPSIEEFIEAGGYVEYSPSEDSLHIPIVGRERPDWYPEEKHFTPDEHEGVGYLTNKFVTFTGKKVGPAGDKVADVDPTSFLLEAYQVLEEELPPEYQSSESSGSYTVDSELSKGDIEEAISHVDPDLSHPQWYRIGLAVHDWDDGSTGKSVFESWSRGGSKWDNDAKRTIEHIWSNATPGDGVTVGTLIYKANENGYEPPKGGSSDRDEPTGKDGNPDLTKAAIMARLGYDPEEQSFRKIPNNEIANAIDEILAERDDYHFRVVDDKTEDIFAYENDTGIWRQNGERKLKHVAKQVLRYQNKQTIHGELIHAVESDERRAINRDQLGAPEGYIGVKNGLLELRERELREPTSDDYLLGRIPTAYDPNASIDGTYFEDYLLQSVAPADREKLQEYAGYCLWHRGQPFKKAMFLIGPTDSGKGTFLETIELVIGDENTAWQGLSDLMGRWGLAKIYGKMVNMSDEVDDALSNVKSFKRMTGGEDTVTAEHKGERTFEFTVTQKFLFATNKFPTPDDAGEPFFNRCLFAEFPNTVSEPEQDKSLLEKFSNERSAILNWMLDGLDRLFEQGHFSGERSITEKREISKSFGSPIDQFAHDALDVTGDNDHVVHKGELHDAFTRFCDYIHASDTPGQRTFTKKLKEIGGITDGKSRRVSDGDSRDDVYKGVRVDAHFLKRIQADMPRTDQEGVTGSQQTIPQNGGQNHTQG